MNLLFSRLPLRLMGVALFSTLIVPGLCPESQAGKRRKERSARARQEVTVLQGRVVKVSDGDTITLLDERDGEIRQIKIRLDGIDAPEKSQPFGEHCRKNLASKVAGKTVSVHVRKQDRYGRSLGRVEGPAGSDINLLQVREGCAWFYRHYAREHDSRVRAAFESAEAQAKSEKLGLWKDKEPQAPWEYRHQGTGRKFKRGTRKDAGWAED